MTESRDAAREWDKQASLENAESAPGRGTLAEAADPATRSERGSLAGPAGSGDAAGLRAERHEEASLTRPGEGRAGTREAPTAQAAGQEQRVAAATRQGDGDRGGGTAEEQRRGDETQRETTKRDATQRDVAAGGAGLRDTAARDGRDRTLSPTEARERFERQRHESPDKGVGFRYGEAKSAPGEVDRFLGNLPEDLRQALDDPRTVMTFRISASRPGTEAFNQRLTEKRGEALTKEMRDRRVQAEIRIEALGEEEHRRAGTPMSLRPPSDHDRADKRDDARFRTAQIEIQPYATHIDMTAEKVEGQSLDRARLNEDLKKGQRLFEDRIVPLGELVRSLQPLEQNPAAPDPSRDPEKFIGQAGELTMEVLKDMPKTAAKLAIGNFLEGARIVMREEVAKLREPLFRAIAEGVAAGLEPQYRDRWGEVQGPVQQELYDTAKRMVEGLNESEKDELALFLTHYKTQLEKSYNYLVPEMGGSYYQGGVIRYFSSDKYYRCE